MKQKQRKQMALWTGILIGIGLVGCSQKESVAIQTRIETSPALEQELLMLNEENLVEATSVFNDESLQELTEKMADFPLLEISFDDRVQVVLDRSSLDGFDNLEVGMVTIGEQVVREYLTVNGCFSPDYLVIRFEEVGVLQLTANELAIIDWTNEQEVVNALVTASMLYGENLSK